MVDLQSQYKRLKLEIDPRIQVIMEKGQFIHGPSVTLFEQELKSFLNVKHVIGVGNGTDALQLAFMALELQVGDEVIIPAFAYAALAEVLLLLNLVPVFVDVDEQNYCIDVRLIESKITPKTRAIAAVHLFGTVSDMYEIQQLAKKYNLFVVEDAAQAIGAEYSSCDMQGFAGCLGDVGTTSFFPSKNLGCYGDGGAVFTNHDGLAQKVRQIANHGQSKKYFHEFLGINSRLDTIQAEILRVKLPYLVEFNQRRLSLAQRYIESFSNIRQLVLPVIPEYSTHIFHQFTMRILDKHGLSMQSNAQLQYEKNYSEGNQNLRDEFRDYLTSKGISSMVYYPLPLHQQKAYSRLVTIPISERICNEVVSLPICPELTPESQDYIINTVQEFFIQKSKL